MKTITIQNAQIEEIVFRPDENIPVSVTKYLHYYDT